MEREREYIKPRNPTADNANYDTTLNIYAECKHPPKAIIEELNKVGNDELRRGFMIGVSNQRGAYCVDPEGKPEKELARTYRERAEQAEEMGYSRYARALSTISEQYLFEAEQNIMEAKKKE